MPLLPNSLEENQFDHLVKVFSDFDLVILQRCFVYSIFTLIRRVCTFLGMSLIFETDDDYLNLPPHNPCYLALADSNLYTKFQELWEDQKFDEARSLMPLLETSRREGLEGYKKILAESDGVIVSTEELRKVYFPFNRNIITLQNNVERVYSGRDFDCEDDHRFQGPDGKWQIKVPVQQGILVNIPAWCKIPVSHGGHMVKRLCRVGYSCTQSHRGNDFDTVKNKLFKTLDKYKTDTWTVYIGDNYFFDQHPSTGRKFHIRPTEYDLYMINLRNLDVGIAPLEPNVFNQSKSPIKAIELGSWGIPCVLPNYITYNRAFTDNENALFYNNEEEFGEQLERMIKDEKLRKRLGDNARELVRENFIEANHSQKRYDWYQSFVKSSYRLRIHRPVGVSNA